MSSAVLEQFRQIGRDLFVAGVISSHGGNLSVRMGDRILITRRGSMLARLEERDIIETGLEENDANVMLASTEINVHRAIYQGTAAQAIVHAHPPYAIARSLMCDEIVPIDSEGSYLLHKVPVVHTELTAGSKEVADLLPQVAQGVRHRHAARPRPVRHRPPARGGLPAHQRAGDGVPHHDHRRRARRAGQGVPQGVGPVRDLVTAGSPDGEARRRGAGRARYLFLNTSTPSRSNTSS